MAIRPTKEVIDDPIRPSQTFYNNGVEMQENVMRFGTYFTLITLRSLLLLFGAGLLAYALSASVQPIQAATGPAQTGTISNDFCLACHQQEDQALELNGEALPVTINPTRFGLSVHAQEGVTCVDCHQGITEYPHPEVMQTSVHDFSMDMNATCQDCHQDQYADQQDSVHQQALATGDSSAPLCSDCHNPHTQGRVIGTESKQLTIAARLEIPTTCAACHGDIYTQYKDSVHGKALTEEGNQDVPTCTNCHGVHQIHDPKSASFHNSTPALCATCHTDPTVMDKYGISTHVLETYVADFHGSTVQVFAKQFPDQPTDKAVCTDCHGVHDITNVDNPQTGIALRENLLIKCQRCHPDATANFPGAWLSHYEPSPQHAPIVYYVSLFYKIFIPAVIGGMIFFILTDIYRRRIKPAKGGKSS